MSDHKKNGEEQEKKRDSKKLLILLLLLITLVAVGITVWAVWFRSPGPVLNPDYAPKDPEPNAETIGDSGDEKLEAPQGGGAVSLIYAKDVQISLGKKQATLLFGNPTKSTQNMVLQLVIQEQVLSQSGLLQPGHQVKTLDLLKDAEKLLQPGGYEGKLVVLYYDQETGEKAVLNTEIAVTVTVTE